ncbi:hypothetical protein [uncultured Chryseobacterium sp.]|uniref:hypothetical protein n=1 Tax=uncultured Chryseobacterium sp. TaxID=259322 RepID=UPI0025E76F46|nr:hypothetical protein [uncultured Chryseobacterium sp.]
MLQFHESFFGSFDVEKMPGDVKDFSLHYYKNEELLYDYRYEGGKLLERKDFDREERHRRVFEYCGNYQITTVYSKSGKVLSKHLQFNHGLRGEPKSFLIDDDDLQKIHITEDGTEEIYFTNGDRYLAFCFRDQLPLKIRVDFPDVRKTYRIYAEYDNTGRIIYWNKKTADPNGVNEENWLSYEDGLVIETQHRDGRKNYRITQYDDRKRPLIIAGFDSGDYLEAVKEYIKTPDEKNLLPVMKIIRLEVFDYDKFGNRTWYEEKYYRPDFSKEGLTYYIQDYRYYDKYNIEYKRFYCRTKEEYDDCSEDFTRLEYVENEVRQYQDDQLMAIHHIEDGKKIKSEYFGHRSVIRETNEQGNSEVVLQEFDVVEKYDTFGNRVEYWVKNNVTGKEDHYEVKVIRN